MKQFRTDSNNNPAAFTADLAKQAGLIENEDYEQGTAFTSLGKTYHTAKLLGDPVAVTIKLIDALGFYTAAGQQRWTYIGLPLFIWASLLTDQKRDVVGFMYQHEGGRAMISLFPNYGAC